MAGYHNDQFFRINSPNSGEDTTFSNIGTNGAGWAVRGADNPPFIYPDRTIRMQGKNSGNDEIIHLKRGYIRSLSTYAPGGEFLQIHKCQFQFNPQTLTQAVESAQSTLNFLQMDPGQYSVPRATSVNFTFDLLFDRSMELNNDNGSVIADGVNPWQASDPSQVGVLRDLAAFYNVIGQGIAPDQAAYMQTQVIDQLTEEANHSDSETAAADLEKAIANVPGYLSANQANSAFLLPTPVRVMFSSLYMVEGFVTNNTVVFTKFNSSMVPMQCALSVTMEAKYIGFAQKNTFLTWSLEQRKNSIIADEKAKSDAISAIYSTFATTVSKMEVSLGDPYTTNAVPPEPAQLTAVPGYTFQVLASLPSATGKSDPVGKLFEAEPATAVDIQALYTLYGPFDSSVLQAKTQSQLQTYVAVHGAQFVVVASGTLLNSNSKYGAVTSSDGWDNLVSGTRTDQLFHGNSQYAGSLLAYDPAGQYFVQHVQGLVNVGVGDVHIQGRGESWVALAGVAYHGDASAWPTTTTVSLKWPEYSPVEETTSAQSGSVPPDTVATTSPQPGSTSKIGVVKTT